jgi:hypothetical protein
MPCRPGRAAAGPLTEDQGSSVSRRRPNRGCSPWIRTHPAAHPRPRGSRRRGKGNRRPIVRQAASSAPPTSVRQVLSGAIAVASAGLPALGGPADLAGTYLTTANVNVRGGPGTCHDHTNPVRRPRPTATASPWSVRRETARTQQDGMSDTVQFGNSLAGFITDYYATTRASYSYSC